jgi:thiamine biosynthesis protein ThiS
MSSTVPNSPAAPITIHVNGETRATAAGTTVLFLLDQLGLSPARVAIEYNLQILPKTKWPDTRVASGDRLEIVQFVGGG